MIYWLHRLGTPLTRCLPLAFCYGIASFITPAVFFLWREKRDNAIHNMAQVLGTDPESPAARRMALRSFVNYAKYLVDMLRLRTPKPGELDRRVSVDGWAHFTQALEQDAGVILVGGHIANSDLAVAFLASKGFPVHIIAETLEPPRWDAVVQESRRAAGIQVIPMDSGAIRPLRLLRQRGILALMIDRPLDDQGVPVTFFGGIARVPGGAAALALRSGARIVCAHMVRTGSSFAIKVAPMLPHPGTGDPQRDLESLTQSIFDWMERAIREHPDQWFMFRRMWRASAS